jgi:hypothetical protein
MKIIVESFHSHYFIEKLPSIRSIIVNKFPGFIHNKLDVAIRDPQSFMFTLWLDFLQIGT